MGASYAVTWKDSEGSTDVGRLALGSRSLRLEGASTLEIAYDDLTDVSVGRGTGDRMRGRTTVILSRRGGRPIWIAPVAQHLVLLELFDRLTAVSAQ
jgi:hypothetical protein